jgi:hypothetical protein
LFNDDGSTNYIDLPNNKLPKGKEAGEYKCKKIKNDREYEKRKLVYFRMIQELFASREKCNLILGNKQPSDPDWFF